jgi:hypothetical protein
MNISRILLPNTGFNLYSTSAAVCPAGCYPKFVYNIRLQGANCFFSITYASI